MHTHIRTAIAQFFLHVDMHAYAQGHTHAHAVANACTHMHAGAHENGLQSGYCPPHSQRMQTCEFSHLPILLAPPLTLHSHGD